MIHSIAMTCDPCLFANVNVDVPNSVMDLSLIGHLYLSGMWSGVAPRTDTKSTCDFKEMDYVLKTMLLFLG